VYRLSFALLSLVFMRRLAGMARPAFDGLQRPFLWEYQGVGRQSLSIYCVPSFRCSDLSQHQKLSFVLEGFFLSEWLYVPLQPDAVHGGLVRSPAPSLLPNLVLYSEHAHLTLRFQPRKTDLGLHSPAENPPFPYCRKKTSLTRFRTSSPSRTTASP
jgi:hypothetical protein